MAAEEAHMTEVRLREEDLVVEPCGYGDTTMGDAMVRGQKGVRITHTPTGVSAESDYYSTSDSNHEEALVLLRHRLGYRTIKLKPGEQFVPRTGRYTYMVEYEDGSKEVYEFPPTRLALLFLRVMLWWDTRTKA